MTTRNFLPSGVGYHPDYIGGIVSNRTGATLTVGELVMVDMKAADPTPGFGGNATAALYGNSTVGTDNHPFSNVVTPTTAGIGALSGDTGYYFGVVDDTMAGTAGVGGAPGLAPGADDTHVHVCWKGFVKVKMASTVGAEGTSPGEYGKIIFATDAVRTATATYTAGKKGLGRLMEENTVANALTLVLFNGIEGFGPGAAS